MKPNDTLFEFTLSAQRKDFYDITLQVRERGSIMSVTKLREKRTRKPSSQPKGKATIAPNNFRRLTAKEIYQMTEPGNRKRNSEICRELVLKIIGMCAPPSFQTSILEVWR